MALIVFAMYDDDDKYKGSSLIMQMYLMGFLTYTKLEINHERIFVGGI
jgi:hypothetical protein